jgi:hypothetical protein
VRSCDVRDSAIKSKRVAFANGQLSCQIHRLSELERRALQPISLASFFLAHQFASAYDSMCDGPSMDWSWSLEGG